MTLLILLQGNRNNRDYKSRHFAFLFSFQFKYVLYVLQLFQFLSGSQLGLEKHEFAIQGSASSNGESSEPSKLLPILQTTTTISFAAV